MSQPIIVCTILEQIESLLSPVMLCLTKTLHLHHYLTSMSIQVLKYPFFIIKKIIKTTFNLETTQQYSDTQDEESEKLVTASEEDYEDSIQEASGRHNQPSAQSRQLKERSRIRKPKRYKSNYLHYNTLTTFQEATIESCANEWSIAIKDELTAHQKNNTWTVLWCQNPGTHIS